MVFLIIFDFRKNLYKDIERYESLWVCFYVYFEFFIVVVFLE